MAVTRAQVDLTARGVVTRIHYVRQDGPANAPVILLLHGHSSSVREFDDLLPALEGKATVFAFDQPSCGESADQLRTSVITAYSGVEPAKKYPVLYYLRDIADEFARSVVRPAVGVNRQVRVAGGSLGGNLSLMLAERAPKYTWLERAYCWSPGSAWAPGIDQTLAVPTTRERANQPWDTPGDKLSFLHSVYVDNTVPGDTAAGRVADHFVNSRPQPWYWYWDCWGEVPAPGGCERKGSGECPRCQNKPTLRLPDGTILGTNVNYPRMSAKKAAHIEGALHSAAQGATPARMIWHWQVVTDQLLFSHREKVRGGLRRVERLQCPTKFMAGLEDRHDPGDLAGATRRCFDVAHAFFRNKSNGPAITSHWFADTGHSVHNERPRDLAAVLTGAT